MQKIKDYLNRFFKTKEMSRAYQLSSSEITDVFKELHGADGNKYFDVICTLFNYGYAKGYRACKAEQKKARKA